MFPFQFYNEMKNIKKKMDIENVQIVDRRYFFFIAAQNICLTNKKPLIIQKTLKKKETKEMPK